MLRTNVDNLVKLSVQGQIAPPLQRGAYRVDREGVPFVLPGTGGIRLQCEGGPFGFWLGGRSWNQVYLRPLPSMTALAPETKPIATLSCGK